MHQRNPIYKTGNFFITIFAILLISSMGLTSCASIGPGTLQRDRFNYLNAISESWKSQILLNLVKLRYADAPVFLDIASVINQYGIQGTVGVGGSWFQNPSSSSQNLSAQGIYTDKPTITYLPMGGEQFARSLMTPIPPAGILSLIQTGYPVDVVLRTAVHSINGINSRFGSATRAQPADPEFYQLADTLRKIQLKGDLGMRLEKSNDQTKTVFILRHHKDQTVNAESLKVSRMLGLDPDAEKISVVYGSIASGDKEIALLTRSILEILIDLASYIDVPESSVKEHRTYPTPPMETFNGSPVSPLIQIFSSTEPPDDSFTCVSYRDTWYWIDDKDYRSKGLFSFIMFIFTLTETGGRQGAPVVTLPAG